MLVLLFLAGFWLEFYLKRNFILNEQFLFNLFNLSSILVLPLVISIFRNSKEKIHRTYSQLYIMYSEVRIALTFLLSLNFSQPSMTVWSGEPCTSVQHSSVSSLSDSVAEEWSPPLQYDRAGEPYTRSNIFKPRAGEPYTPTLLAGEL